MLRNGMKVYVEILRTICQTCRDRYQPLLIQFGHQRRLINLHQLIPSTCDFTRVIDDTGVYDFSAE